MSYLNLIYSVKGGKFHNANWYTLNHNMFILTWLSLFACCCTFVVVLDQLN